MSLLRCVDRERPSQRERERERERKGQSVESERGTERRRAREQEGREREGWRERERGERERERESFGRSSPAVPQDSSNRMFVLLELQKANREPRKTRCVSLFSPPLCSRFFLCLLLSDSSFLQRCSSPILFPLPILFPAPTSSLLADSPAFVITPLLPSPPTATISNRVSTSDDDS